MKSENSLREFARRLSEEDLKFLFIRFNQMLGGDRGDIVEFLSRFNDIDKWLRTSVGADELFEMLGQVGDSVKSEYTRRYNDRDRN